MGSESSIDTEPRAKTTAGSTLSANFWLILVLLVAGSFVMALVQLSRGLHEELIASKQSLFNLREQLIQIGEQKALLEHQQGDDQMKASRLRDKSKTVLEVLLDQQKMVKALQFELSAAREDLNSMILSCTGSSKKMRKEPPKHEASANGIMVDANTYYEGDIEPPQHEASANGIMVDANTYYEGDLEMMEEAIPEATFVSWAAFDCPGTTSCDFTLTTWPSGYWGYIYIDLTVVFGEFGPTNTEILLILPTRTLICRPPFPSNVFQCAQGWTCSRLRVPMDTLALPQYPLQFQTRNVGFTQCDTRLSARLYSDGGYMPKSDTNHITCGMCNSVYTKGPILDGLGLAYYLTVTVNGDFDAANEFLTITLNDQTPVNYAVGVGCATTTIISRLRIYPADGFIRVGYVASPAVDTTTASCGRSNQITITVEAECPFPSTNTCS